MAAVLALVSFRPNAHEWMLAIYMAVYFFAGSAYCFLINDLSDRKKDIANNKLRPIATGKLGAKTVIVWLILFGGLFLVTGYIIGTAFLVLALLALLSFSLYSFINSRTGLLANCIVAFWAVAPMWEMQFILSEWRDLTWLATGLFIMVIIREVQLDWLDIEGDAKVGKPSVPMQFDPWSLNIFLTAMMVLGLMVVGASFWYVSISLTAYLLLLTAMLSSWYPFILLLRRPTRKVILFNVRFSHISFALFAIALWLR